MILNGTKVKVSDLFAKIDIINPMEVHFDRHSFYEVRFSQMSRRSRCRTGCDFTARGIVAEITRQNSALFCEEVVGPHLHHPRIKPLSYPYCKGCVTMPFCVRQPLGHTSERKVRARTLQRAM